MKLRTRTVVLLVTTLVPVTLFFSFYRIAAEKRFMQERMAERFAGRVLERSGRSCEGHDGHWGPRRHELDTYTYGVDFQPRNSHAPPFPDALRFAALSDEPVHIKLWAGPYDGATGLRTGMGGTCELAVIYWPDYDLPPGVARALVVQALFLIVVLVVTGLVISAPLVRRIRELAKAVLAAPHGDYKIQYKPGVNDEVEDLAHAFNLAGATVTKTIAELEARDHTLKAYVANTTHDLAIPITVLQHRLQALQSHVEHPDGKEALRTAMEESAYVAALVRNLNVSAKLDAREVYFHPSPISLSQIMERVVLRHRPIADLKRLEMNLGRPETEVTILADSTLLEQALSNVVQNAVQHGPAGGHVAVILETQGDRFELSVLDDGPGIPPERLEQVITARTRGQEARSRHPEGLGLGLAIVTSVCDLHGWTFRLSNLERGLAARICGNLVSVFKNESAPTVTRTIGALSSLKD